MRPSSIINDEATESERKSDDEDAKALTQKIRKLEEKRRKLLRGTGGNDSHQRSSRRRKKRHQQVKVPLREIIR